MFKKNYRLPKGANLRNARVFETPFFRLKVAQNGLLYNRYSFIVSKIIDKRAVVRNKTKRRFRKCVEDIHFQLSKGYDMLFIIRKKTLEEKTKSLCLAINILLKKEKLLL